MKQNFRVLSISMVNLQNANSPEQSECHEVPSEAPFSSLQTFYTSNLVSLSLIH